MSRTSSEPPKLVVGPLALVAVAGLWRGLQRRSFFALGVGLASAAVEFGSSDYRRFKRRWTLFSITEDK